MYRGPVMVDWNTPSGRNTTSSVSFLTPTLNDGGASAVGLGRTISASKVSSGVSGSSCVCVKFKDGSPPFTCSGSLSPNRSIHPARDSDGSVDKNALLFTGVLYFSWPLKMKLLFSGWSTDARGTRYEVFQELVTPSSRIRGGTDRCRTRRRRRSRSSARRVRRWVRRRRLLVRGSRI